MAELFPIGERGEMLLLGWRQRAAQIAGGVAA
jgi:hypothetical protein